jgi:multiple sugar transport system substrate-binding protein
MTRVRLRAMTWDHRRAIDPLVETLPLFQARHPGIDVTWTARPLHGFEFTPVDRLARDYDLIVLDHPFAGSIAKTGCLVPLDGLIEGDPYVGPSLASYRFDDHLWAVPIDAACQVAASRPDLLARLGARVPRNWEEVLALGTRARRHGLSLAIGLQGVHSLMTFFTLCANLGRPCAIEPEDPLFDAATAREALALLRALLAHCPHAALDWNSIALHEVMSERDDLVFCPAVYCYATYAEADRPARLAFHDLPGPRGHGGSTIGGTGLGVSAHCAHREAACAYARFVAERETQFAFARHHGQPAHRDVWEDEEIDRRFLGCFRATRATIETSWVRPRYHGYLDFQAAAGALIERHLRGEIAERELLDRLAGLHSAQPPRR